MITNPSPPRPELAVIAIVISIITTVLLAAGSAFGFFQLSQGNAMLLANYGARITNLEQERSDDRHDTQTSQQQISTRLDTIVGQISGLQTDVAVALAKAAKTERAAR